MLIAALGLTAVWLLAPAPVPIYDGIGTDQPYRYVNPPPGAARTAAPTIARAVLTVVAGRNAAGYANSGEVGPQISVYVPAGALHMPLSARQVTLTATPTGPRPPLPTDGGIVSNVYELVARADTGAAVAVVGTGDSAPTLQMRAPSSRQPGPVVEHLQAGRWRSSPTLRVGQDVYQAPAPAFGAWALVQLDHPTRSDSGSGINVALLATGIGVLALTGGIVIVRRWRLR